MSPQPKDYLVAFSQLLNGEKFEFEKRAADQRVQDIAPYIDTNKRLRVLDLANGRLRPQYMLLQAEGHLVFGIDLINQPNSGWLGRGYEVGRWLYSRHVDWGNHATTGERLVCGDAGRLPFREGYFDLVSSVAAFEHFLNVPGVVGELWRVMRPGGVAWIGIHPFTSPSGGHNITATEIPLRNLPKGVEAWDHLRKRRVPLNVPLNEWRIEHYLAAFSKYFEIMKDYCVVREGEHLLSPEIEAELAGYGRDELTCMAYIIVARKNA